jgi:hypothetical protein
MEVGKAITSPARSSPYSSKETSLFELYQSVVNIRERKQTAEALESLSEKILKAYPDEWILLIELLEEGTRAFGKETSKKTWVREVERRLENISKKLPPSLSKFVHQGIELGVRKDFHQTARQMS